MQQVHVGNFDLNMEISTPLHSARKSQFKRRNKLPNLEASISDYNADKLSAERKENRHLKCSLRSQVLAKNQAKNCM